MDINSKAARIKTLRNDDTFKEVIAEVKQRQIDVFTTSSSSGEELEKAHSLVCALEQIEVYMDSVISDQKFQEMRDK